MPFVSNMDEEQKTDPSLAPQGAVAPVGGGSTVRLSPSSAVAPAGGSGPSGSPGTATTPSSGGQFASLQNYLAANQGQATPLAGKLTPGINQEYGNLDTASNAAIANINKQVTNAPGYTPSNPDVMSAEAANPASFTSNPNNVKQFQSLLQNTYGGPTSAEDTPEYANQQAAINAAIAKGTAQTTTEAGRENLLAQNEATPTTGVTALNSAILSQDPNALASIEGAYKPFQNLLTNLQTGAQEVNKTISQEQQDAAASSKAASDAINSQIAALNTGVSGGLTSAQQKAAAQNAQLKSDIAAGIPSQADLQAMGITSDQWNTLTAAQKAAATAQNVTSNQGQFGATSGTANIDLTNFLTQQDPNAVISAANVATPQDYAKAQAFQTLLQGMNLNTPTPMLNPAAASQAGTAPTNLSNFDYQTALNTAQSTKADEVAAAQAYVDALQSGADEQHAQQAAQQAGRQSVEQKAEALANTAVTLPVAVASKIPVIGAPISNAVDTVVQAVSCFVKNTPVEMEDGSFKRIQDVEVGDLTRGGRVTLTMTGESDDLYDYRGVKVVGGHIVKESRWVEVENSESAIRLAVNEPQAVYCLCTTDHSIWVNGIEFHDAVSLAWFHLNFMKNDQKEAKDLLFHLAEKRR